jgi:hypothetical protein
MPHSSMFEIEGCGKSQSWLSVEPDGRITLICGDDYYNGTMSLTDSLGRIARTCSSLEITQQFER